jgi:hypothetical protein
MTRLRGWIVDACTIVVALIGGFGAGISLALTGFVASTFSNPLGTVLVLLDFLVFLACGATVVILLRRARGSDLVYVGSAGALVGWLIGLVIVALLRYLRERVIFAPAG